MSLVRSINGIRRKILYANFKLLGRRSFSQFFAIIIRTSIYETFKSFSRENEQGVLSQVDENKQTRCDGAYLYTVLCHFLRLLIKTYAYEKYAVLICICQPMMSWKNKNDVLEREDFDAGPTNLDEIEENLWLGNLTAATDIGNLEMRRIDHILTLDSCPLPRKITELKNKKFLYVKVTDTPREDMISHFEETYNFIKTGIENGVVLVHCYFGVSRSATVVIAYLMKKLQIKMQEAVDLAKSKRRFIGPNPGFLAQLQLYETMHYEIDRNNVQYRMFRLYITADQVKKVKILPQGCTDVLKPDPSLVCARPDPRGYRCRKCRRIVALTSNLLPHAPKEKYSWRDSRWSQPAEEQTNVCSMTYFLEPLAWMPNVACAEEGRLMCPQCQSKLGFFSWTMGCQCPCGTRVCPAFYLVPSKVDKSNFVQNVQVTV